MSFGCLIILVIQKLNLNKKKGPIKLFSCENQISVPFSCILIKQNQTFGLTVKGDCPVRINQLDPNFNVIQFDLFFFKLFKKFNFYNEMNSSSIKASTKVII